MIVTEITVHGNTKEELLAIRRNMSNTRKDKPWKFRQKELKAKPRKKYHMRHLSTSKAQGNWNCPCCVPLNCSPAKAKVVLRKRQRRVDKHEVREMVKMVEE